MVVDRRFVSEGGAYYTQGPAGPETGEKYMPYFNEIVVVGREDKSGLKHSLHRLDDRIRVVLFPNMSSFVGQLTKRSVVSSKFRELIADVDAVIVRVPGELGYLAARVAENMSVPLAADLGGCAYDDYSANGSLTGKIYAIVGFIKSRSTIRRCQYVSYVTQKYLQLRYPAARNAITLAASNVSIETCDPRVLQRRLDRIKNGEEKTVFGTIGSLVGNLKGIHVAIEALGLLRNDIPSFEYRVLGGGDNSALVGLARKLEIEDRVFFDGVLTDSESVMRWLDNVDVYLQPSLREGLSRATIEAMSRGCPAIASDVAATNELLEDRERFEPASVSSLIDALGATFNLDWRLAQSERNWARARLYTSEVLSPRKRDFWGRFAGISELEKPL